MNTKLYSEPKNKDAETRLSISTHQIIKIEGSNHFQPLLSDKQYTFTDEAVIGGSSEAREYFTDQEGQKWFGKSSLTALKCGIYDNTGSYNKYNFEEVKELLALRLYKFFGVKTPEAALSFQPLNKKHREKYAYFTANFEIPQLHIMSRVLDGLQILGPNFLENYFDQGSNKSAFCINNDKQLPLKGFGRAMAVSILVHDYDCFGASGGNMGFVKNDQQKCAEIVKIDPGAALSFTQSKAGNQHLENPPKKREALISTRIAGGIRIRLSDLKEGDKKEFVQTAREILKTPNSKIEDIFREFLALDERFKIILDTLLERKQNLLAAFSPEVQSAIQQQISESKVQTAENLMSEWGKPMKVLSSLPSQGIQKDSELIQNKAQLEAYVVAANDKIAEPKLFQVPPHDKWFIGKYRFMDPIESMFESNEGIAGGAITGEAGMGKSLLASEYIHKHHETKYSRVIWIHAEQKNYIIDQIQIYLETCFQLTRELQHKDSPSTVITKFYQALERESGQIKETCIVFDNAENMSQIKEFLPNNSEFSNLSVDIIVTSRYKQWGEPIDKVFEAKKFFGSETEDYIRHYIKLKHGNKFCSMRVMKEIYGGVLSEVSTNLSKILGGLPLAITLAVAHMIEKGMSIIEFYNLVRRNYEFISINSNRNFKEEVNLGKGKNEPNAFDCLATVLTLSLADIRSKHPHVEQMLDILAYLSAGSISIELLRDCWKYLYLTDYTTEEQCLDACEELLELLDSYSVIEYMKDKKTEEMVFDEEKGCWTHLYYTKIYIHRMVQETIRINHQKSNLYEARYKSIFDWLLEELIKEQEWKDPRKQKHLTFHGDFLDSLQNTLNWKTKYRMYDLMGIHMQMKGEYRLSIYYFEKCLEFKVIFYGEDRPEYGVTLNNLGNAWGSLGNYEKKRDMLIEALQIGEKHYGKDHPEYGVTLASLGNALERLGNYEKARDMLNEALRIKENHYGKDHPEYGVTLSHLGNAWGSLGNYEKQRDMLTEALRIKANHYGKDHPEYVITLTSLGNAWGGLGNYEKKRDILAEALRIDEKHYGKDHPEYGATVGSLGNAWGRLGNYEKQRDMLTEALRIKAKHYGKDHPEYGATLASLGNAWGSLGNYEKQRDMMTEALRIKAKHYGKGHPSCGVTLASLGNAWGRLGNYEKARDMLTEALRINEKHYGKDHPLYAATLASLGNAWGRLGSYEKARDMLTEALLINEKHYGKAHPEYGVTLNNLGNAWGSLGNYEKKRDMLIEALQIGEKHYGKDHPEYGVTLNDLGNAWGSLGNYEKQRDMLTEALLINEKHYGKDHPEYGVTLSHLGNAWGSLGSYEKARDMLTEALRIKANHYGKDHPEYGATLTSLGDAWGSLGNYEKQRDMLTEALLIKEKHYGEDHPSYSATLSSLGNAWGSLGSYEKQRDMLTEALQIKEKYYGKDHPEYSATVGSLGNAWGSLGSYEKARDMLTEALRIKENHYGKGHPEYGATLTSLGDAWGSLGNYEKQRDMLTEALLIKEKHYGEDHPSYSATLSSLGNAWGSLGSYEKQRDMLTEALQIKEKYHGKDHPEYSATVGSLGNAWGSLGSYEKARDMLTEALRIKENHYGKGHPEYGVTLSHLGDAWGRLGNYEKKRDILTEALRIFERYYPSNHSYIINLRSFLFSFNPNIESIRCNPNFFNRQSSAIRKYSWLQLKNSLKSTSFSSLPPKGKLQCFDRLNKQELILMLLSKTTDTMAANSYNLTTLLSQSQNLISRYFHQTHPIFAFILLRHATVEANFKNYNNQKNLLLEALTIMNESYGPTHPLMGIIYINLGVACSKAGDKEGWYDYTRDAYIVFHKHFGTKHKYFKFAEKTLNCNVLYFDT